jgi:hypothetical protein
MKQDKGNRCLCCGEKKPSRKRRYIAGHPAIAKPKWFRDKRSVALKENPTWQQHLN